MSDRAPIYREDQRDGVPMTPLRSLSAVLTYLAYLIREDMAGESSVCDHLLCQDPPRELRGAVADFLAWADALNANIARADRCLEDGALPGASRYRHPLPEVRVPVQRIREAVTHLADVLRRWCEAAELEGDALEEAARRVRNGTAQATDHDGVIVVLPVPVSPAEGEPT